MSGDTHQNKPIQTAELSPFVGALRIAVDAAIDSLLKLGEETQLDWRLEDQTLVLLLRRGHTSPYKVRLRGLLSSSGDTAERLLSAKLDRVTHGNSEHRLLHHTVRQRLSPDANLSSQVAELAAALEAYAPFCGLSDQDFRSIQPSPDGNYGVLRLGTRCNQRCHFCWQQRQSPAPPPRRFEGWLKEMAAAGVCAVHFTGGEPTTFRRLSDLVSLAASHGLLVSLETNAVRLANHDFIADLQQRGLSTLMVSFHSGSSEVSDRITGAPGSHRRTVQGITNALELGLAVMLTCVVEGTTLKGLEQHAQVVVERFVRPFANNPVRRVAYAHPTSYATAGLWRENQLSIDEIRGPLTRAAQQLIAAGVAVQLVGSCGFPHCALRDAPELIEHQMFHREIFDAQQLQHRHYLPICQTCARRQDCFGLRPEYIQTFGDLGLVPFE